MVAAGGEYHSGSGLERRREVIEVDETATDLEGADRSVVLVFDPDFAAAALTEQAYFNISWIKVWQQE